MADDLPAAAAQLRPDPRDRPSPRLRRRPLDLARRRIITTEGHVSVSIPPAVPPELQPTTLFRATHRGHPAVGRATIFFSWPFFAYLYLGSLNSVGHGGRPTSARRRRSARQPWLFAVASSVTLVLAGAPSAARHSDAGSRSAGSRSRSGSALVALQVAGYLRLGFWPGTGLRERLRRLDGADALFPGDDGLLETLLAYGRARATVPFRGRSPRPSNLIRPRPGRAGVLPGRSWPRSASSCGSFSTWLEGRRGRSSPTGSWSRPPRRSASSALLYAAGWRRRPRRRPPHRRVRTPGRAPASPPASPRSSWRSTLRWPPSTTSSSGRT